MSLRAANRLAAMRRAQRAALDCFEDRGFDGVTVEEIADVAELSASTIYRHFGTKERLALWDEHDSRVEKALARHLGKDPPIDAIRLAFVDAYSVLNEEELQLLRRQSELIDREPALSAAMNATFEASRVELAEALRKTYRRIKNSLYHEMVARVAFAAVAAGFENWQRTGRPLHREIAKCFQILVRVVG